MKKFLSLLTVGMISFGAAYYGEASIDPRPSKGSEGVNLNCLQPDPSAELKELSNTAVLQLDLAKELEFSEGKPSLYFKEGEVSAEEKKFSWWEGTPVCSITLAGSKLVSDPKNHVALRPGLQQLSFTTFPSTEWSNYVMVKGSKKAGLPDYVLHCEGRQGALTVQNLNHAFGNKLRVCKTESLNKLAKNQ